MAEGHTIICWAQALTPLVGEPFEVVQLPKRFKECALGLVGHHLRSVETWGKHLLLHLSDGRTIHCHAMMYESWQIGKVGMKLRKQVRHVRLRLRTVRHEAVFFHGPVVEVLTPKELAGHPRLKSLGPDLLSPKFDREEVWRRLKRERDREIGDVVLDQRIVAGIGNIYKSEGLFLAEMDPRRRVETLTTREIERLWEVLIPLMWLGANTRGPVTTVPERLQHSGDRNWVYRRRGEPCFRCGTAIVMFRQGELDRTTYYCPNCQH